MKPQRIQRKRVYNGDYRRRWHISPNRPRAECHPKKPHKARGLCAACYCAICKRDDLILSVDHDHETGKIRGLLCLPCNGSLGWFERMKRQEQDDWLSKARVYLSQQNDNQITIHA